MTDPTSPPPHPEPPYILGYVTWVDADGFHARPRGAPPGTDEIHASTAVELSHEGVRARVRGWVSGWTHSSDEPPFRTGDLP